MAVTKCLTLEDGNLETTLFRLNKGWRLKFTLAPSLQPYDVQLFCNHPLSSSGDRFQRDKFNELSWTKPNQSKADNGDRYSTLNITTAGSFHFYLVNKAKSKHQSRCQGYFVVDPTLEVGSGPIPLDSVVLQTVLSKCLGLFSDWEGRLKVGQEAGYNMFHFTPIQELGESNSSYSLKDQLHLNTAFSDSTSKPVDIEDIKLFIKKLETEWDVLSVVDVVWNHTANNTAWLQEHPEAAYNLENSPHMRPAYIVDTALWYFSNEISQGKWEQHGIPSVLTCEGHLEKINDILRNFIIPPLKLHEFFIVDIEKVTEEFRVAAKCVKQPAETFENGDDNQLTIIQDPSYKRNGCRINMKLALALFNEPDSSVDKEEKIEKCCWELKSKLFQMNEEKMQQVQHHYDTIISNSIGHIRYHFVEDHGPKYGKVTRKTPLVTRYFTSPQTDTNLEEEEKLINSNKAKFIFAHPGWVMGGDALKDFAASDSNVYLKRDLIAWGDSVKLRYGKKPEDSPFLWDYMKKYTQLMARTFHGFRVDNCHSTPLAVAEFLIDAAREANPELYVIAELFTNSEDVDNTFINRLGINSLVRERMSSIDAHDLGRHVFRYGGEPVGSFLKSETSPLRPSMAHALFMDVTHDNRSLIEVHSPFDCLPSCALVAISSCAIGSNRGYDELVPEHIDVVTEDRKYKSWKQSSDSTEGNVSLDGGILRAKKALNLLHQRLARDEFNQIYVDQVDANIVSVTRHCQKTHESLILIAHTAFDELPLDKKPITGEHYRYNGHVPPLVIPGILDEIVFEAQLLEDLKGEQYVKEENFINGLENYVLKMQENINVSESMLCVDVMDQSFSDEKAMQEVHFNNFIPGSVIIFKVSLKPKVNKAIQSLKYVLEMFPEQGFNLSSSTESHVAIEPIDPIIAKLTLADLNRVLYRCDAEERDDGYGGGVYNIPNFGNLTYCGLQGLISVLTRVAGNNDLGHPICDNLRQGDWMPSYTASRLKHNHGTRSLGLWLEFVFWYLRELPSYLVPCYFDAILKSVYVRLVEHAFAKMNIFVQDGSDFVKYLSLGSVQMCGLTNTPLPPISPKLDKLYCESPSPHHSQLLLTMAAGLPHFSIGFMRCWGRDTFISLRGLLLVTSRFDVARNLILSFAGCIRHGLIPNLLGGGYGARYNCRDASWWWLQAIQDFCKMAPQGIKIILAPVKRMYPNDDSEPQYNEQAKEQPLFELMQEVLQRHIDNISFRERGAGPSLDTNMSQEGFNQTAGVDLETGFIYGGSKSNCGTWMDKMGESTSAGNWGHPATSRDGSAVEIVGLSKSALRWISTLNESNEYPYSGVKLKPKGGKESILTFQEWNNKIQQSFEDKFWISCEPDPAREGDEAKIINRRGIYKDLYKATHRFTDYQFRPNFPIAMAVAPELFDPEHAWHALKMVEDILLGPLGLSTLDSSDWMYDGNYDNSQETTVFKKAKGFNYHQGPEWIWVIGPFLRAKLHFSQIVGGKRGLEEAITFVRTILARHKEELASSPWRGLPELTNIGGAFCKDGCPTQAWSLGCVLEVLYDMEQLLAGSCDKTD